MNSIFAGDFSTSSMSNWTTEQHVPDGYDDFVIRNNRLVFLDAGNRLLPNIPAIENFQLECAFDADWHINDHKFSWTVFFGYDTSRRQGPALEISSDGSKAWIKLLASDGRILAQNALDLFISDASVIRLEITVQDQTVFCKLNDQGCFNHKLPQSYPGLIALTRGSFLGELRLHSVAIASPDRLETEIIWQDVNIPFAQINGMDIPIVWTVNAVRRGDAAEVEVTLSGGEKARPDVPWFPYHGHYVEFLKQPYLRIESARQCMELPLSDETLAMTIPRKKYFYVIGHKNPPWPFKKTFYLRNIDSNAILFAGYKAYGNRAVNKHLEVFEPYETAYDAISGKTIYAGRALPPEAVTIELKSPPDKQICKAIPDSTLRYEQALAFARKNHYFFESEACRFHFDLVVRGDPAQNPFNIEYRIENAFFEPLTEYTELAIGSDSEQITLDIIRRHSPTINLGPQPPGVYHLRFRLSDTAGILHENYRAFEVIGDRENAISASRLPKLFSMSNEVKGQDTDYFDPWRPDCSDVSHYISICTGIMPHFARERRFWELLKIYKREWFLWLGSRVVQDFSIENNRDLIEQCDYIKPCYNPKDNYYRPCTRQFFHKDLLRRLYDFALAHDFHVTEIKSCLDAGTIPDKATFDALVNACYYPWIDFFWDTRMKEIQAFRTDLESINPRAKISCYGPVAVYGGIYKTAHACTYAGNYRHCKEIENFYDGYFMLEDYPHSCRYSINGGPFFLASFKAVAPEIKVYPEMYNQSGAGVPCPDAAVARAWPSYGGGGTQNRSRPVSTSIKRVLEYVYGCVWHNGKKFDYWRDYGFHTRVWERARYAALLKTWGFIVKHPPIRPLRAPAFICNEDCCRNQKLFYDEYPGDNHEAHGDLFNTAEESSAYAYEMSRTAGQNAGFVTDFDKLSVLSAAEIDILVIPPLTSITPEKLSQIRRLHEQGVSLLGFEAVAGLEDLFGVVAAEPGRVHNIRVNASVADNPLAGLAERTEYTEHRACVGKYRAATAEVLLDAEVPVLFRNRTKWGKTALFNIPPTAVRRQDQFNRVAMGRASISYLINESVKRILRHLSSPTVETSAGKIIAFEDADGGRHIVVMEDAHPFPARAIRPVITVNLPGLDAEKITCTRDFNMLSVDRNAARLGLSLAPDEFAIINF